MTQKPLRVIVTGAAGRMGSLVAALASRDERFKLAGSVFHQRQGEQRGAPALRLEEVAARLAEADALVDFTTPEASVRYAATAAEAKKAVVIGTTGFSAVQRTQLERFAQKAPVFLSPNFSPGVHLLLHLCAEAARALKAYDVGIHETHHSGKKDAPSGTALKIAEAVMQGRGGDAPVPTASERLGGVVGEHTLTLAGPFERLELTHRAQSREVFAQGALEAALWVQRRKPGLYGMPDMLGVR